MAKITIISESGKEVINGITLQEFNNRKCSGKVYAHPNTMLMGDFCKIKEADSIIIDPFSSVPAGVRVINAAKLNDSKASKFFKEDIDNGYIEVSYFKTMSPSQKKNDIFAFEIVEDFANVNARGNIIITGSLVDKVVPIASYGATQSGELSNEKDIMQILYMLKGDEDTSNMAMTMLATTDYKRFPVEMMMILKSIPEKISKSKNKEIKDMLKYFGLTPETVVSLNITTATNFLRSHGQFTKENALKLATYFSDTFVEDNDVWQHGYCIKKTFDAWD